MKIAFFLNFGFTILEFFGGIYVNSIAIISDAVHDLGDSLSLGTSWYLQSKSEKSADEKYSFGYGRLSLVGALINSIVLISGSSFVIYEAVKRLIKPEHSDANGMILFAIIGIAINGIAVLKISKGTSLNEKVVFWHLLEDVLGWVAVLVVAIILKFKDIPYLDPALSIAITSYVLWGVIGRLKDVFSVFLQGIPKEIDLKQLENRLLSIKNVKSVHHIHIWSMDGEHHVFTAHVKLKSLHSLQEYSEIKKEISVLLDKYHFSHHTVEIELEEEKCSLE